MATVLYFVASEEPTEAELADIATLEARGDLVHIRTRYARTTYGFNLEPSDFVAGFVPEAYSSVARAQGVTSTNGFTVEPSMYKVPPPRPNQEWTGNGAFGGVGGDSWTGIIPPEPEPESENSAHVFLIVGQSNSTPLSSWDDGEGFPEGVMQLERWQTPLTGTALADNTAIPAANQQLIPATTPLHAHTGTVNNGFGFTLQFVIDYKQANPDANIVLVHCGHGSTGFRDEGSTPGRWIEGQDLFEDMVERMERLHNLHPEYVLKGVLFHQGERDSDNATNAAAHQGRVETFRERAIARVPQWNNTTPFIVGGLVPSFVGSNTNRQTVVNGLKSLVSRIPYTGYADPEVPTVLAGDGGNGAAHYAPSAYRGLGSRYKTAHAMALLNTPQADEVPSPPTTFIATAGDSQVSLMWIAPTNVGSSPLTGYQIQRNVNNGGFSLLTTVQPNQTQYIDTTVTNDQTYDYRILAQNIVGNSTIVVSNSVTPEAAVVPMVLEPETLTSVIGHWVLGSDRRPNENNEITGIAGTTPLTVTGNMAYRQGYATIGFNPLNGLDTGALESASSTMVVVARVNNVGNKVIIGDWNPDVMPRQALVHESDGFRHRFVNSVGGGQQLHDSANLGDSQFKFIAISRGANNVTMYTRSGDTPSIASANVANDPSTVRNIAVGPLYDNRVEWANAFDVAEIILFDEALTQTQLNDLYTRSVERMAFQGITLGEDAPAADTRLEPRALGHWLLGDDNAEYQGLAGPDMIATGNFTVNEGYVDMPTQILTGLDTGFRDRIVSTMVLVAKIPNNGNKILIGTFDGDSPRQALIRNSNGLRHNFFATDGSGAAFIPQVQGDDVFKFIAVRRTATERAIYVHDGTNGTYYNDLDGFTNEVVDRINVAVGPLDFDNTSWATAFSTAEVMYFDEDLTEIELEEVYNRTATRLSTRNVTLGAA